MPVITSVPPFAGTQIGDKTVMANQQSGLTNEAKITAAIARAVLIGALYVYVPANMLPYNASLVTFNTGITMIREGGAFDVYDLKAYGAYANGVNDDTPSITAAFNAAPSGGTIYAPVGTYNHTALTWNKRVSVVGESSTGTVFSYTPGTGTGWLLNAANIVNDPTAFGFYRCKLKGSGFANATTGMNVACDYLTFEDVGISQWGLGTTYGSNSFFVTFTRCGYQFNNQHLIYPTGLTQSGENLNFDYCTFVNAQTFANAVQIDGNCDFYLNSCSIDNSQLAVTRGGASVFASGCHFELVNINPAVPMISQVAGILSILGGRVLVPASAAALPSAINVSDSSDAGNAVCYIYGVHGFSTPAVPSFLVTSGGIHCFAYFDIQGSWVSDVNNGTTGSFVLADRSFRVVKTSGIAGGITNQLDTTLVSGVDVSGGNGCTATITAARLIGAPLNPTKGQRFTFILIQGGAGGFAITWNAIFKGLTWSDTGNATGKRSSISFTFDGTNWNQDGAQAPYAT